MDADRSMIYKLDQRFITQDKLKTISLGLSLILIGSLVGYFMAIEGNWAFLTGVYCIYLGFKKIKEHSYWESNSGKIALEINADHLSVSDIYETQTLNLNNIDQVVLQPIHGKIKSIILYRSGGRVKKLQGFEAMDEIANQLKELLGESKIKTTSMFHR